MEERPDPPDFSVAAGCFGVGFLAAVSWWGYQAFTWLKTGQTLDWSFVTILHQVYPRSVGLDRLDLWAACSSNPVIPDCTGSPPSWAGIGKLADWLLTLDVGFGLIVTAAGLGIVLAALIIAVWVLTPPFVAGWTWLRPYLAPVLDPLIAAWQRWVHPPLNAIGDFWVAFLTSRLGISLMLILYGALFARSCFGS